MPNPQTNVRLSETGRGLLEMISQRMGLTNTAVVELAIREYAKQLGLWSVQEKPKRGKK